MALDTQEIEELKDMAKRQSPISLIRQYADPKAKEKGRYITGEIRADIHKSTGYWMSFSGPESIGDNINLYKTLTGEGFIEAIQYFTGVDIAGPINRDDFEKKQSEWAKKKEEEAKRKASIKPQKVKVPPFAQDPTKGREYLLSRGITPPAILEAERQGAINYVDKYQPKFRADGSQPNEIPPAVSFLGRNRQGETEYVALRYFDGMAVNREGQHINKKDLPNSSKRTPMTILPLEKKKPYEAFIVEGGTNALATLDMCMRGGKNALIMTTGGVSIREWLENDTIVSALAFARKITFIGEYETLKPGTPLPDDAPEFMKRKNNERALPGDSPEVLAEKRQRKQARIDGDRLNVIQATEEIVSERRKRLYQIAFIELQQGKQDRRKMFFNPANRKKPFSNLNPNVFVIPQIIPEKRTPDWKAHEDISDFWKTLAVQKGYLNPDRIKETAQEMTKKHPTVDLSDIQYLGKNQKAPATQKPIPNNGRPILAKGNERPKEETSKRERTTGPSFSSP